MTEDSRPMSAKVALATIWLLVGLVLIAVSVALAYSIDDDRNPIVLVVNGLGWIAAVIGAWSLLALLVKTARKRN